MRHTEFQGTTLQGFIINYCFLFLFLFVMQPAFPQSFTSEFRVPEPGLRLSVASSPLCLYIIPSLPPHMHRT